MIVDALGDEVLPKADTLFAGDMVLYPGTLPDDIGTVLSFAMKDRYNQTPEPQIVKGLELCKYLWIAKANDTIGGVIMLCYLDKLDWWTLDAYKGSEHDNADGDFSYRAGQLVIDWFFNNLDKEQLRTIHRTANRAATKLCERLGFVKTHENPEFICLSLRRPRGA